jgi:protein SCO1/2
VSTRPALVAAVAALLLLAGCGGTDPPARPGRSVGTSLDRAVPARIQHLPFTTSSGARVTLAALRGKVVVLTDFLTLCSEQCPMTSANVDAMARAVHADGLDDKAVFVEVTVDPVRDTPARLAAYRQLFAAVPDWLLLTTTPANLAAFCRYFGIFYKRTKEGSPPDVDWWTGRPLTYDVAHQDAVVFLDPQLHERFVIVGGADTQGATPPRRLASFLNDQGAKNLRHPGRSSWTVADGLRVVSWLLGRSVGLNPRRVTGSGRR